MSTTPLTRPVSTLLRGTFVVDSTSTLGTVAAKLRENSAGLLPVVSGHELVGVVSERSLALALARGAQETDGVELAYLPVPPLVRLYETGAEALRSFEETEAPALVVVDDNDHVAGILRPSDLLDPPKWRNRPPLIGGMATPFGVYLTSGSIGAGAGGLSLVATGSVLFLMLSLATFFSLGLHLWLEGLGMQFVVVNTISSVFQLGLFAATFRLLPIAGIHAAEHMVVHTIERGEPLMPEVVKRMPRVHPRCGTNLAVGASLFLGIATSSIPGDELRLILAMLVTILLWRRIGGFVQYWVTTRPPNDRQIELGIKAGKELLEKQSHVRQIQTSFPTRIWNSGMLHVMAGSMLVLAVISGISALFGIELPL